MQSTMISSFLLHLHLLLFFFYFYFGSSFFLFSFFFMYIFALFLARATAMTRDAETLLASSVTKCSWFPVRQAMRLQYHCPYRYDILRTNRETNEEQKLTIMLLQNFMPCTQSFTIRYNLHFLPSFLAKRFELDKSLLKFTSLQDVFPVRHSMENSSYFNFRVHIANRSLERARKRIPSRYL